MKTRLTLDTGKEVVMDLEVSNGIPQFRTFGPYVIDGNGVGVLQDRVIAIEPITEPEPAASDEPESIIDGDGERWVKAGDGYFLASDVVTLDYIREMYGIQGE